MIKSFEQFVNENYNNNSLVLNLNEEYGSPLFNQISESLVSEIHNSINEGKLVIEEGLFDTIGKLFKKGSDIAKEKNDDVQSQIKDAKDTLDYWNENNMLDADDLISSGRKIKNLNIESNILTKIEELYSSAVETCEKLSEKEEDMYKTVSEKMDAANNAIKEFAEMATNKIKEIVEESKNKISDTISAVVLFSQKMAEFSKKAIESIGKGTVLAFTLPFIFAYSVYKGAVSLCNTLVEKSKDAAKVVKEAFVKIKNSISNWVVESLNKAKDLLKTACDAIKDGYKKSYNAIGKAYLTTVGVLGQLASDVKDKISDAYNAFVDSVKKLADDVKSYVSAKWDIVSNWCKKTSTSFAEGVKNVWDKTKEKVMGAVDAAKDAYKDLKDNANATWNDIKDWSDEKQQKMLKATLKYAVDKWGKEEVSSWL
jgi:gas vesicle protein